MIWLEERREMGGISPDLEIETGDHQPIDQLSPPISAPTSLPRDWPPNGQISANHATIFVGKTLVPRVFSAFSLGFVP